jgi:NADPH:quinone reductase-like Zn-dependent oxidoreductase
MSEHERAAIQSSWPDSAQFWRSKRVVVTGGASFLGSYVVQLLKERMD